MDTTIFASFNWLAVVVAAVAYFMLGAVWYSMLFKNIWIKGSGIDMNSPEAKKGGGMLMIMTLVLEFVTVVGLAILAYRQFLVGDMINGVKLGLLTGVCFAAIAVWISFMYQMKPKSMMAVDGGYHILGHVISGAIICAWP
jgi:hypothetical protein